MFELFAHRVDFGLVVLLWLVQLVIYPSFLKIQPDELVVWHRSYTFRASFIIIPLMFTQMVTWLFLVFSKTTGLELLGLGLVVTSWILTFFVSVPLHKKIERGEGSPEVLSALVTTNWYRTICWTAVFIVGLIA